MRPFAIIRGLSAIAAALLLLPGVLHADEPQLSEAARKRLEFERRRQIVADALSLLNEPAGSKWELSDNYAEAERRLLENADDSLPFIINELDAEIIDTFSLMARVLGQIEAPEAREALIRSIERAEAEPANDEAAVRKRTLIYALADNGDPSAAVRMLNEPHIVQNHAIASSLTVAEAVAGLLGPAALPTIHATLVEWADDEELSFKRNTLTAALRRAPDASSIPVIQQLLLDDNQAVRREAARALQTIDDERSLPELLTTLFEDNDRTVRFVAANAIERIGAPVDLDRLVARLEEESDTYTRGLIYRIIARQGGRKRIGDLLKHGRMPDPNDRRILAYALGLTGSVRAVNPLVERLADSNVGVIAAAAWSLSDLDSKTGIEQLRKLVMDDEWARASIACTVLHERRDPLLADLLLKRLMRETAEPIRDVRRRSEIEATMRFLLQYNGTITPSEEAAFQQRIQNQPDVEIRKSIVLLFSQLRRMKAFALDEGALKARVLVARPAPEQREAVESAVRHCPTQALSIDDD